MMTKKRRYFKLCEDDVFGMKWFYNSKIYVNRIITDIYNITAAGLYWALNESYRKKANKNRRLRQQAKKGKKK